MEAGLFFFLAFFIGCFLKYMEFRSNKKADDITAKIRSKYPALNPETVRPKDQAEARETIRRHDPALALLLDVLVPVDVCDHKLWRKHPVRSEKMYDYSTRCGGCGLIGKPYGPRSNGWLPLDDWKAQQKRLGDNLRKETEQRNAFKNANLENYKRPVVVESTEIHEFGQLAPVAEMVTVYDPITDTYKLITSAQTPLGTTEYYAQVMTRQMMQDRNA